LLYPRCLGAYILPAIGAPNGFWSLLTFALCVDFVIFAVLFLSFSLSLSISLSFSFFACYI
jgi:hypothetical protein